jgi:diguanylate cyclase (GGDEF)-like protein
VYDSNAVSEGLLANLLIFGPSYLLLGGLILAGKERLVELREEARRLSLADPLTGLANRRALIDLLSQSTAGARRGETVGLVLVDLDGFKEANTLYGHPGGDTALVATAAALKEAARTEDMVSRLGGDEFAIVARGVSGEALDALAGRALRAVRAAGAQLDMPGYTLRCSVGAALYPIDAGGVDELVAAADVCMRGAKAAGKDRSLSSRAGLGETPPATAAVA